MERIYKGCVSLRNVFPSVHGREKYADMLQSDFARGDYFHRERPRYAILSVSEFVVWEMRGYVACYFSDFVPDASWYSAGAAASGFSASSDRIGERISRSPLYSKRRRALDLS